MDLLLLSLGTGAVPGFLAEAAAGAASRVAYLGEAAAPYGDAPFVVAERAGITALAADTVTLPVDDAAAFAAVLDEVDAVYVAGGETFHLLARLRAIDADRLLAQRVRGGLAYIGCSAGSVLAGATIEPVSLMDDPALGVGLTDLAGLGLIEQAVVPHADGLLPPYPRELIERTLQRYGDEIELIPLRDDQALRVRDGHIGIVPSPR